MITDFNLLQVQDDYLKKTRTTVVLRNAGIARSINT